jgi:hypothetical protein
MEVGKEMLMQLLDVRITEAKESLEKSDLEQFCTILGDLFAAALVSYVAVFVRPEHWSEVLKSALRVLEEDMNNFLLNQGGNSKQSFAVN